MNETTIKIGSLSRIIRLERIRPLLAARLREIWSLRWWNRYGRLRTTLDSFPRRIRRLEISLLEEQGFYKINPDTWIKGGWLYDYLSAIAAAKRDARR
jgi:hypothetical protein